MFSHILNVHWCFCLQLSQDIADKAVVGLYVDVHDLHSSDFIIQQIVTASKYGHDALDICHP